MSSLTLTTSDCHMTVWVYSHRMRYDPWPAAIDPCSLFDHANNLARRHVCLDCGVNFSRSSSLNRHRHKFKGACKSSLGKAVRERVQLDHGPVSRGMPHVQRALYPALLPCSTSSLGRHRFSFEPIEPDQGTVTLDKPEISSAADACLQRLTSDRFTDHDPLDDGKIPINSDAAAAVSWLPGDSVECRTAQRLAWTAYAHTEGDPRGSLVPRTQVPRSHYFEGDHCPLLYPLSPQPSRWQSASGIWQKRAACSSA